MRTNRARKLARWLALPPALFALACALLAPAEAGRAPSPGHARRAVQEGGRRREPVTFSTVRGRVVYDETSRPARRARVMLVGEGGTRGEHIAMTDARGEFLITGVPAGTYFAFVDVPGVLSPVGFVSVFELGGGDGGPDMPDLGEGRRFFDLIEVDGKRDVNVTVHARRGGALGGRVSYADGDPAVNVTVNLMRRGADGRLQKYLTGANIVSLSGLRTDDRGAYRVSGLPPGEYLVGVSETVVHGDAVLRNRSDDVPSMVDALMGQQFLMTFHPSATSAKEAALVKVEAGEERADVDVTIPERELRAVAGVVRARRDRRPVPRARVTIVRRDDPAGPAEAAEDPNPSGQLSHNSTTTDAEGRWEFREIPDGPYTVHVRPSEEEEPGTGGGVSLNANTSVTNANTSYGNINRGEYRRPRRRRPYAPARRDVEVSGGDASEVLVEVGEGGRVSGTLAVEGGGAPRYAYVSVLRVPDGAARRAQSESPRADVYGGLFSIEGLPAGRFFLDPSGDGEGARLYVKSITWNGKDLMREPLELAEGASAEGVQVLFSRNPAQLNLTAVGAGDGKPARYAGIYLLPADLSAWSHYAARQLSCSTGDRGTCSVEAPPGDYHVVALPRALARGAAEAEVRRRAAAAPRVSLRAGETKEFEAAVPER